MTMSHRIPTSLQAVFLASNRGVEVCQPPPERVAFKVFFRNWRFQVRGKSDPTLSSSKKIGSSPQKNKKSRQEKPSSDDKVNNKKESERPISSHSPQVYLDTTIRSRGYSTSRFKSLQTGYHNKPSQLQLASYDIHISQLVRDENIIEFREIIVSGISPNPCNQYGESLLHTVCRKGRTEFLLAMLDAGASVQVSDDYGRTPLHDACWAARPCFDVVKHILQQDARLVYLTDCRGAAPLSYVPKDDWSKWLKFIDSIKDEFWPQRDTNADEEEPPHLAMLGPNTRTIPSPPNALTVELAAMVASGKMTPAEVRFLFHDDTSALGESDWEGDSDNGSCDDSYASDDDEEDDDLSIDELMMAEMLKDLVVAATI